MGITLVFVSTFVTAPTCLTFVKLESCSKVVYMMLANLYAILFASPIDKSDSWIKTGTPRNLAAITAGTETKPPLEKRACGFILKIITRD